MDGPCNEALDPPPHPRVTVITVCRNAAATIGRTLASVAAQTYPNLEHVVIDGCSEDGTQRLVRCAPHRPRLLWGPDQGIYDAMNKGLRAASGDLLLFLNADDRLADPRAIARLAAGWGRSAPRLGMLVAYGDHIQEFHDLGLRRIVRGRPDFTTGMGIRHQTMLIPASVYARVGAYDTAWSLSADLDLAIRIRRAGIPFVRVPGIAVICSRGGASDRHHGVSYRETASIIARDRGVAGRLLFAAACLRAHAARRIAALVPARVLRIVVPLVRRDVRRLPASRPAPLGRHAPRTGAGAVLPHDPPRR